MLTSAVYAEKLSGIGGAFADIGLGLRPLGMGGAYSALAADENAARWNPALLDAVKDPIAGFTWTKQFNLIQYNYLAAALTNGFGCYAISAGDDVLRETTIGLGFGINAPRIKIPIDNLRIGVTAKILFASFGNNSDEDGGEDRVTGSSFGYGLDIGFHYQASETVSLALVSRELVNNINWDTSIEGEEEAAADEATRETKYSEGLPQSLIVAAAYEKEKLALAVEYHVGLYGDVSDRIVFGAETVIFKIVRPRMGFAQNLTSGNPNQWITAGLGMEFQTQSLGPIREVKFGYTHLFHHIDFSPRVGLVIGW